MASMGTQDASDTRIEYQTCSDSDEGPEDDDEDAGSSDGAESEDAWLGTLVSSKLAVLEVKDQNENESEQ